MKPWIFISRILLKPATLWGLFAAVFLVVAGGLGLLSAEALRLSHDQQLSQQQDRQEQEIRVALWRLDSRMGPYIATLHDPTVGQTLDANSNRFVLERFRIERDPFEMGSYMFKPLVSTNTSPLGKSTVSTAESWQRLVSTIPVDAVVTKVENLLPQPWDDQSQSLLQSYAIQMRPDNRQVAQRELQSRNAIVQQQVALSNSYAEASQDSQSEMRRKGSPSEDSPDKSGVNDGSFDPFMESGEPPLPGFRPANDSSANDSSANDSSADSVKLMSAWIDDDLVVVRSSRTVAGELDGVWVDWPLLRASLIDDVADLIPHATIRPVRQSETIEPSRTLAAIPAMVDVPAMAPANRSWSATHTSLLVAWCALAIAALIAGFALSRLIALSERRAAFVSAVTHEMRTPLTTFRLYSDLLARDMVAGAEDRKEYLETLRREADRLTHLVDNVLRYSKLQRASKPAAFERIVLSEWIERISPRLTARLAAADMRLECELTRDGAWSVDPPAMEQLLFNLVDNAAKYAASASDRRVHLRAAVDQGTVTLRLTDHGPGVPPELRSTIFRPFTKSAERAAETAAGVGLGLALARQTATALGGQLMYHDADDGGASFEVTIPQRI